MAIAKSKNRTHVPRVHVYPDHVFIVVHAPEIGVGGPTAADTQGRGSQHQRRGRRRGPKELT
jgi:hypothetical protein